jgi:anti-sigma B factor antagonist
MNLRPTEGKAVFDDSPIPLAKYCSLRAERHLDTTIIRLAGEFDLACEERFQEELANVLDGAGTFVLDLRGLEFIDSTVLRVLVQLDAAARSDDFDFTVLCGNWQVRRVLRESGLDGVLPVVDPSGAVPASDSHI